MSCTLFFPSLYQIDSTSLLSFREKKGLYGYNYNYNHTNTCSRFSGRISTTRNHFAKWFILPSNWKSNPQTFAFDENTIYIGWARNCTIGEDGLIVCNFVSFSSTHANYSWRNQWKPVFHITRFFLCVSQQLGNSCQPDSLDQIQIDAEFNQAAIWWLDSELSIGLINDFGFKRKDLRFFILLTIWPSRLFNALSGFDLISHMNIWLKISTLHCQVEMAFHKVISNKNK